MKIIIFKILILDVSFFFIFQNNTIINFHFFILFQNKNKDNKFESNDESLLKRFSTALKINQNLTKLGLRGL